MVNQEAEDSSVTFGRNEVVPRYLLLEIYHKLDPDKPIVAQLTRIVEDTSGEMDLYDINVEVAVAAAVKRLEELDTRRT